MPKPNLKLKILFFFKISFKPFPHCTFTSVHSILIIKHKAMDKQNKIILLSKFFAKDRIQGDSLLDRLFELDDIWSKVYEENHIKFSFSVAKELANERILNYVLSDNYS